MAVNRSASARAGGSEDEDLLLRVAWYYYKDQLTQAEIAQRLSVSRATAARLLERARARGIVKIEISTDRLSAFQLSQQVRERFRLRDVLVVPGLDGDASPAAVNTRVAQGAAQYLNTHLRPGVVVGVGWGDTVARTLLSTNREVFDGVTLVTLTGGVDGYLRAAAGGGMNGVADQLNVMPAPLLASSPAVAATLREEAAVRAVMERAQQADVTLIGIGAVIPDASIMLMGLQTADQLRGYAAQGATGDILGELYDDRGRVLALDLHEIRIGIPIASLRDMRLVVAAAGGLVKVPAILGALRGGYVDVLVTSEDVAQALLRAPA